MDVASFCAGSRVLVVAGKGGVGKTTMTAALARMASDAGLNVLVVELEGRAGLAAAFGHREPLSYDGALLWPPQPGGDEGLAGQAGPSAVARGSVRGRRITPDDALLEYLADHGLRRVSRRLVSSGVVDVVATAIPGIRDVLVLGKVKQLEREGAADLVLVDAPATGHAVTFLTSASGLLDAARGGPVRTQAADVVEMLHDPARCRVVLVTLPEEMPVSEAVDAAYQLEDRAGIQLGPVVVNGCDEPLVALGTPAADAAAAVGVTLGPKVLGAVEAARTFQERRLALQAEQLERLGRELPLPQLRAPKLAAPAIGPHELRTLSAALATSVAGLAPEAVER
jgi:anion-transporting  ArsA/GET3 family ATPase